MSFNQGHKVHPRMSVAQEIALLAVLKECRVLVFLFNSTSKKTLLKACFTDSAELCLKHLMCEITSPLLLQLAWPATEVPKPWTRKSAWEALGEVPARSKVLGKVLPRVLGKVLRRVLGKALFLLFLHKEKEDEHFPKHPAKHLPEHSWEHLSKHPSSGRHFPNYTSPIILRGSRVGISVAGQAN